MLIERCLLTKLSEIRKQTTEKPNQRIERRN